MFWWAIWAISISDWSLHKRSSDWSELTINFKWSRARALITKWWANGNSAFTLCQLIKRILKNSTTRERVTSNWYRSLLCFLQFKQNWWKGHHIFFVKIILNWQVCQMTHFSQYNLSMIWTLDLASTKSQVTVYAKSSSLLLVRFYSPFPMLYPWKDRLSIGWWLISPSPVQ